jgi:pyruvate/2-oxoglutarate dehydrogenase complex dihydrolipoamide dehydrogenase (E3) component
MKTIVDADSQILGGAILGIEGGELMARLEIAMLGKLPCPVLREAIFAQPTLAGAFTKLFGTLQDHEPATTPSSPRQQVALPR